MKERHERTYTFHPDDLESLFKQIIESQDIILPELKRHAKFDKVNDLKYYKYHCILGHTLQDYFVFKDKLHELIDKNTMELDADMRVKMGLDKFGWKGYYVHLRGLWFSGYVCTHSFLLFILIEHLGHHCPHVIRVHHGHSWMYVQSLLHVRRLCICIIAICPRRCGSI